MEGKNQFAYMYKTNGEITAVIKCTEYKGMFYQLDNGRLSEHLMPDLWSTTIGANDSILVSDVSLEELERFRKRYGGFRCCKLRRNGGGVTYVNVITSFGMMIWFYIAETCLKPFFSG